MRPKNLGTNHLAHGGSLWLRDDPAQPKLFTHLCGEDPQGHPTDLIILDNEQVCAAVDWLREKCEAAGRTEAQKVLHQIHECLEFDCHSEDRERTLVALVERMRVLLGAWGST